MIIDKSYHMSEEVFTRIYRAHCHIKYHMRRSLVMSFLLLVFGLVMEYGFQKDFKWMNLIVLVLFIICLLCNYICDYRIPRLAYFSMYENEQELSTIKIEENGICSGEGDYGSCHRWDQFNKCYETKDAFLLYQKDTLIMIWKGVCDNDSQLDEVRKLLQDNVNHGKAIAFKK